MARVTEADPLDKHRFQVFILGSDAVQFGCSSISLPKITVNEIKYRENMHGTHFIKKPGLATYEPVILRKGVTGSRREFYDWIKLVHDYSTAQAKYMQALQSFSVLPVQNPNFRKNIIISAMDRTGATPKHWVIYEAFPIGYTPGSLDAAEDGKMIEEITLTYEGFVEVIAPNVNAALAKVREESEKSRNKAGTAAAQGAISGIIGGFL